MITYIDWNNTNENVKGKIKQYREDHQCGIFEAKKVVQKQYFMENIDKADSLEYLKAVMLDYVKHRP